MVVFFPIRNAAPFFSVTWVLIPVVIIVQKVPGKTRCIFIEAVCMNLFLNGVWVLLALENVEDKMTGQTGCCKKLYKQKAISYNLDFHFWF